MTEKEIIHKIKEGDIDFFRYLVQAYSEKMRMFIKARVRKYEDADDILQNSFLKVYKSLDHFDENRPFYPYFFSIVKNEIIEFYRKNKQALSLNEDFYHEEVQNEPVSLEGLKKEYKNVLQWYSEGFSYKEIAKKMKISINTVKTMIRRARLQILRQYNEEKS